MEIFTWPDSLISYSIFTIGLNGLGKIYLIPNSYGIISLSKTKKITYQEAEKYFFDNVSNLTDQYIDEMNKNGKLNGSYFKGSFLADDLSFCHEVTRHLQLVIMESLGE